MTLTGCRNTRHVDICRLKAFENTSKKVLCSLHSFVKERLCKFSKKVLFIAYAKNPTTPFYYTPAYYHELG